MNLWFAEGSRVSLTAVQHQPIEQEVRAELQVEGSVELQADARGELSVVSLDVSLGEIVLEADELPPAGIHLRDVRVTLGAPADGETLWTVDDEHGVNDVVMDLELDWKLVAPNGDVLPLATQHLDGADAHVEVWDESGRLAASLRIERPGRFFQWAGLFELSDLEVDLVAAE